MDYTRTAQNAERILRSKGRAGTISRTPRSPYNAATSEARPGTPETYPIVALNQRFSSYDIDGENIRIGDVRELVYSKDLRAAVGDIVTLDGAAFRVIDPRPLKPNGVPIIYDMVLRKA